MDPLNLAREAFTQCNVITGFSVALVLALAWRLNKTTKEKDELQRQARQDALDRVAQDTANMRTMELAMVRIETLIMAMRRAGEDC
jgi:hypothetical protein